MKYKLLIIIAAFASLLSCKKEEAAEVKQKATISISESVFNCAFTAGDVKTVEVTSNGAWTVDGLTDGVKYWLSVEPLSGNGNGTVTVKCIEQNPREYKRAAVLSFQTADNAARLVVRQLTDPDRTIVSSEDELDFGAAPGEELTTDLFTNKDWVAEGLTDEVKKWLSVDPVSGSGNGTVTFRTTDVNETPVTRYATIGFRINRVNCAEVVVSQPSGIELDIDPSALSLGYAAGLSQTMNVSCNAKTKGWFIEGYDSDVQAWLDIDKTSGMGNETLAFTTKTQNDDAVRTATLTVKVDSVHYSTFTVSQASSLEIHLDQASMQFSDSVLQKKALKVTTTSATKKWYVEGYTDEVKAWLKLSDTTFTGLEKEITVETLCENRTAADREVTLKFCFSESIFAEVTVKQPMIPLKTKKYTWSGASTCTVFAPVGASYAALPWANGSGNATWNKILDGKNGAVLFNAKKFTSDYENEYVFGTSATNGFTILVGAKTNGYFCHPAGYASIRSNSAYYQTPAIPGYRLSRVQATSGNGANSSVFTVSSDKEGTAAIDGVSKQPWGKPTAADFTLKSTEANTSYYMYIAGDRLLASFTWTYIEVR